MRLPPSTPSPGRGSRYRGHRSSKATRNRSGASQEATWSTSRHDGHGGAEPPTYAVGGQLDLEKQTWSELPPRPQGTDVLAGPGWATGAGGDVALLEGWALHVPDGRWTQLPALPGPTVLTAPTVAFTGERFLAWGGQIRDAQSQTYATNGSGWVWEPAAVSQDK